MNAPRKRRIVVVATVALLFATVLIAWVSISVAPEVDQARVLRIGMTESEVNAVMGREQMGYVENLGTRIRLTSCYGQSTKKMQRAFNEVRSWIGLPASSFSVERYPVRVRYYETELEYRVDLIVRGNEIEEAPPGMFAQ